MTIKEPHDFFEYEKQNLEKSEEQLNDGMKTMVKRTYLWISKDDITQEGDYTKIKTVKGTRKLHDVSCTDDPTQLLVRKLSCFCDECLAKNFDACENKDYAGSWEKVDLQEEKTQHVAEVEIETVDNSAPGILLNTEISACYIIPFLIFYISLIFSF